MPKKPAGATLSPFQQQVYELLSGDASSVNQLAPQLGLDPNDPQQREILGTAIHDLQQKRLIDIAVDRKAEPYCEDSPVGKDTYRYYRRDEGQALTDKGKLSKAYTVQIGVSALRDAMGEESNAESRARRTSRSAAETVARLIGSPKEKK